MPYFVDQMRHLTNKAGNAQHETDDFNAGHLSWSNQL
jgi:hypothetical protein